MLEVSLGEPLQNIAQLTAGTSTGSIIAAGIASGISAKDLNHLYVTLGPKVFPFTMRKLLFPLTPHRYPSGPLEAFLNAYFGERRMGDFWLGSHPIDVVITAYDLKENRNRFIKPWKEEYANWQVALAVRASCTVPTYFPIVEGRYIDGGVGAYANPCYLAAYEAVRVLEWDPNETTLLSFGTGRDPYSFDTSQSRRIPAWDWIAKIFGVFLHSAEDQQVHLVESLFDQIDFRRFQIDLSEPIPMDDVRQIDKLVEYGKLLGQMVLDDRFDRAMHILPQKPSHYF